jgi:hypothetical protein
VNGHWLHVGTLLGPALLIAFWAAWSDLRAWMHRQGDQLAPTAALVAAVLCSGAALIHGIVMPSHLAEDVAYGGVFAVLATAQLAWAAALLVRPSASVLWAGAVGNLTVVALWALTRTAGIPLGAAAGRREAVGALDVVCGLLELGVAACCITLLRTRRPVAQAA